MTSKRKVGRPKKSDLTRSEQFSIRLVAKSKATLEIMAKLNNGSLSDIVDLMVFKYANTYQVDSGALLSVIEKKETDFIGTIRDKIYRAKDDPVEIATYINDWRVWLWTTDIGKLFLTPDAVLSEHEKSLVDALYRALFDLTPDGLATIEPDLFTKVSADVNAMLALDTPRKEIISYIKKYLSENAS